MRKVNAPNDQPADPIWTTINGARHLSGLGRSTIYELIQAGVLQATKVGGRRLVSVASIRTLGEQAAWAPERNAPPRRQPGGAQ